MRFPGILFCLLLILGLTPTTMATGKKQAEDGSVVPAVAREFRGAWVATVENIDWPSKRGLNADQQKAQLRAILDRAVNMHLNALVFQVRPACDALYDSKIEPWSEYLTGVQGRSPGYDPLEYAVTEAHKRGLELHAWFNPYRAKHPSAKSPCAPNHVSKVMPDIVRKYGAHLWLDPGDPRTRDYTTSVIMDVVNRYDIDGVHLDDYFYPYAEEDKKGHEIPFPDNSTYAHYVQDGGTLSHDDWRRENVNILIERLYKEIKAAKPWVKFGISPFGIWRPGSPSQIKGYDAYSRLFADSRKWLKNGWADYFTPQLYWKIEQTGQSFPVLLNWWISQNDLGRHIWPGSFTSRVGDGSRSQWPASEIVYQVKTTRGHAGSTGMVHFSMKTLMQNRRHLCDQLCKDCYNEIALIPACPWLSDKLPDKPLLDVSTDLNTGQQSLTWKLESRDTPWLWVVQKYARGKWYTELIHADLPVYVRNIAPGQIDRVAVSAVDRYGNQGAPALLELRGLTARTVNNTPATKG